MKKTIALELKVEDAEPILRQAATDAAKWSSYLDHFTRDLANSPIFNLHRRLEAERKIWKDKFLSAKRIVEAFGVEYEQVSEAETLTVYIPERVLKSHVVNMGDLTMQMVDKSEPDYKNPHPAYRGDVHREACRQAADRVVRAWKATLLP